MSYQFLVQIVIPRILLKMRERHSKVLEIYLFRHEGNSKDLIQGIEENTLRIPNDLSGKSRCHLRERERETPPTIAQTLVRKCKNETCSSVKVTWTMNKKELKK